MINIYVFLDNIPFASEGILYGLENSLNCRVKSFYPHNFKSKRSSVDTSTSLKRCYPINYDKDIKCFEMQEGNKLFNSLFISFGYLGSSFSWASNLSKKYNGKCFVISERPTCVRKMRRIKTPLVLLKHFLLRQKVQSSVDKLFVTGESSLSSFKKLGWDSNKLVSFYYCPLIFEDKIKKSEDGCFDNKKGLDFIYSGRLTYRSKSPQRLIPFFSKNPDDRLFIIGNYGDDADKFKRRCSIYKNIVFLGSKQFQDTINYIKSSDCVLIPSSVDGWNINVNIAVYTKTPCVITNNSGSNQIISLNGNGVVSKNTRRSFTKSIYLFKANYLKYKKNANTIKNDLTPSSAAERIISTFYDLQDQ